MHLQLAGEFNPKDLELPAVGVNVPRSYLKKLVFCCFLSIFFLQGRVFDDRMAPKKRIDP